MGLDLELIEAAKDGDLDLVRKLITEGADINVKDDHDYTPLFYALEKDVKRLHCYS